MSDVAAVPADEGAAAPSGIEGDAEQYRGELTGYAYRMLGSAFEAEDAVQDTLVRAWRSADKFEGRSSLRSWLYRIATNVCIDMLNSRNRRALPLDLSSSPSPPVESSLGTPLSEETWVGPLPDSRLEPAAEDPAERAVQRESIRLAFIAALQQLPARQRAVLILRDVLRWKADEVAQLLDTTTASVNSALQRARATLSEHRSDTGPAPDPMDEEHAALLARYVELFERYDIDALVSLLHEDATQSMPPYALWLRGPVDIAAFHLGPGSECRGSQMLPVMANGSPAFAQYRRSASGDGYEPWGIHTLEITDGRISQITNFLGPDVFTLFGLPLRLED
ncbi:MAG TPA: sigma-70 family RNA polymerase sigma factor [Jiangellaceae bacterium]|nr:sigma-70 family RNA polymerase sigma factor [Jiangellaceae bacterium]